MDIKPWRVFGLFVCVGVVLIALAWLIPSEGLKINDTLRVKWIPITRFFPIEVVATPKRDSLTAQTSGAKDTLIAHSTSVKTDSAQASSEIYVHKNLYFNAVGKENLERFFTRLKEVDSTSAPLHILHFGDSQLDGDRITQYLREAFQQQFGGSGCGLVTCLDPVKQVSSVWINASGNWATQWVYDEFRRQNSYCFGLLGSNTKAEAGEELSVIFTPSPVGNSNCRNYTHSKLFLSATAPKQVVTCYADRALYQTDTITNTELVKTLNYRFPYPPHRLEFSFSGTTSPTLHGCLLDGSGGVQVDNVALRGQLFTRFLPRDSSLVATMAHGLNTGLIILEFGANLLPTKASDYTFYEQQIENQIVLIKKFIPNAPILIVGVGDAAERVDGELKTLCSVQPILQAQKSAALHSGAVFFNLFTAMGGAGTIVKWSNEEPKRALTDYIHYNARGGKEVANLIYQSIHSEYQLWLNQQNSAPL